MAHWIRKQNVTTYIISMDYVMTCFKNISKLFLRQLNFSACPVLASEPHLCFTANISLLSNIDACFMFSNRKLTMKKWKVVLRYLLIDLIDRLFALCFFVQQPHVSPFLTIVSWGVFLKTDHWWGTMGPHRSGLCALLTFSCLTPNYDALKCKELLMAGHVLNICPASWSNNHLQQDAKYADRKLWWVKEVRG